MKQGGAAVFPCFMKGLYKRENRTFVIMRIIIDIMKYVYFLQGNCQDGRTTGNAYTGKFI